MKYTITMSCGHEERIELFGSTKERDRKIDYFMSQGLCSECYKKKMQEEAEKEGFNFNSCVLPYISNEDGSILLSVWFSGNTKPFKDDIKSLGGYSWSEREPGNDSYLLSKPMMCWNKVIKLDELKDEIIKAESIGANNIVTEKNLFEICHYQIALKKQKKWNEKKAIIESIEKPTVPEVLKGCTWNQKIYGRSGGYTIYPNGNKISITDDQKKEIENYLKLKKEYQNEIEIINKMP